jgi:hypothetical protein
MMFEFVGIHNGTTKATNMDVAKLKIMKSSLMQERPRDAGCFFLSMPLSTDDLLS